MQELQLAVLDRERTVILKVIMLGLDALSFWPLWMLYPFGRWCAR
ncbi:MAG: hypothetical protein R3C14_49925 [Caldilineaceae bacterium]